MHFFSPNTHTASQKTLPASLRPARVLRGGYCFKNLPLLYSVMVFWALLAFFTPFSLAQAEKPVPALTGRVVDLAHMIGPTTEQQLEATLKAHEEKTGNQLVILTIPSLEGENLETYSLRIARQWQLGQKGMDNGILFLIAKNDRKMRIETGYGVEGVLTDAIASFILRRTVRPLFKQRLFEGGITAGAGQIIEVLESDPKALEQWKKRSTAQNGEDADWPFLIFFALVFMIIFGGVLSSFLVRTFGREIKPGHYRWLGIDAGPNAPKPVRRHRPSDYHGRHHHRDHRSNGGFSGGNGGGFGGGGGGFGGGGSSGGW